MSDDECENYDEDDYAYEEEDGYDFDEVEERKNMTSRTYKGIQFDGNLSEATKEGGRAAIYPVYKQLSEFCLVDIDSDFFSATLSLAVRDQIILVSIQFPKAEPYFPNAPPVVDFQSKFKHPNHRYNLLFNCHPLLLKGEWNLCTDVCQIVRDIAQIAETCTVETVDDDYYTGMGVQRTIIKLIRNNELDITSLVPDTQMNKLPSFGVVREKIVKATPTRFAGTGYSSGHGSTSTKKWNVSEHNMAKIEGVVDLIKKVNEEQSKNRNQAVDDVAVDAVYFIFTNVTSRTVTMEEFFSNLTFYELVTDCLLPFPPPSPQVLPLMSLMKLHQDLVKNKIKETLEGKEKEAVEKLERLHDRLAEHAARNEQLLTTPDAKGPHSGFTTGESSLAGSHAGSKRLLAETAGSGSGDGSSMQMAVDLAEAVNDGANCATPSAKSGWLSFLVGTSSAPITPFVTAGSSSSSATAGTASNKSAVDEFERVNYLETAFTAHKFLSEASGVSRLDSKWYRRMKIELGSIPESVPGNALIFSGMHVSQPNLLKILMFPENDDTPYCGGCFEFDVFIPAEYPKIPPKVLLVTTGHGTVRFNPNLYNCGKVCLSLLGTWQGEPWNPETSNIAQVINSILFLIFVEQPYFNEPGYQSSQGTASGDANSETYNAIIRKGTLEFAYLDHFKKKSSNPLSKWIIPMLCDTWRNRAGRTAAEGWVKKQANLQSYVDQIEAEVAKHTAQV